MTDDKAAELLAAVRAVESGERPAASFFTAPGPGPERGTAPRPAAPTSSASPPPSAIRPASTAELARSGPVPVPDEVRAVLTEGGAPEALAVRVVESLGEQAAEVLRADPWQLLATPGVRPEQADGFARGLLGAESGPADERRAQALVGWLLERAALAGHTALEPAALAEGLSQHAVPDPDEAVRTAVDAGAVLVFEDSLDAMPGGGGAAAGESEGTAEERPVNLLLGLDRYALAEESLADGLARLISTRTPPSQDPGPDRPAWEEAAAAAPSPSAAELIRAAADHGLV
ncbi:MAG: helix-hairpin-helix domain-containing protein, partial [Streptomyces sp.]|uniref:helix-hairpin-helix domain-containing protein n=1 Tax=Streptomyces sp. TaxID=1931 RepID=UPI003D6B969D